jgi:hypothetical protein
MNANQESLGVGSRGNIGHGVGFDIVTLDNSLLEMLLTEIQSIFRYTPVHFSENKHLKSAFMQILKMIMIYSTGFRTPAMRALGVKALVKKRRNIHTYVFISTFLPLCYTIKRWHVRKLKDTLKEMESTSTENESVSDIIRKRAFERQYKVLTFVTNSVRCIIHPFILHHHLAFMFRLRPTPSIAMNMSDIQYDIDETSKRSVNLMYGYRRLWYEELLLTLSILPIDVWRDMPKNINLFYKQLKARINLTVKNNLPLSFQRVHRMEYDKLDQSCGICNIKPIPVPYEVGCGHLYCYTCLRIAVTDNIHYCCMICGARVISSRPFIPSKQGREDKVAPSHTQHRRIAHHT